ncbi:hypothetical protein, partial [Staphylococcus aureus]|uniref:hypothetical protein n=1 Tax=Staphylococcus aureus TaxID=1280 RepID=UPI0038B30626
ENQFAPHHNINNRYGNLSNIPNQSSFGNLFSAQQFPDENQYEAMTQYSNLIGSNQGQPIQTSRFQNLYGGVQRYQSEGDNIENSPNSIPK